MLMASDPKIKILVCTPSNKAVDEIVFRLATTGLVGKKVDLTDKLIRVHGFNYKTENIAIQKYLLDNII